MDDVFAVVAPFDHTCPSVVDAAAVVVVDVAFVVALSFDQHSWDLVAAVVDSVAYLNGPTTVDGVVVIQAYVVP